MPGISHNMTTVQPSNLEANKLASAPAFDWLRFVLASIVALDHEGLKSLGPLNGTNAVDVFLALSGWLIGGILLRTSAPELPRFFFNRVTRIWVPYAVAIILLYGLGAARTGINYYWFKYLFFDATFTHFTFTKFPQAALEMPLGGTGNHFWSISVEEQFYLFAPLIAVLAPAGRTLWLWMAIAISCCLLGTRFTPIVFGVTAAVANLQFAEWHRRRASRAIIGVVCAGTFAALFLTEMIVIRSFFAVSLVLLLSWHGRRSGIGMFAGGVSYPLYLNHWIGSFAAAAMGKHVAALPQAIYLSIAYGATVAVGIVAYLAVDRQILHNRAKLYTDGRGRLARVAAYGLFFVGLSVGSFL